MAVLARALPAAILNGIYNVIARHRYRVFGRYEQCLIPRPEHRSRFVD
jgi:predicted DCC family thiol-disulfide oxidoreductase YuxK